MKQKINKIRAYIFRSWEDEPVRDPRIKILPPFLLEVLVYFLALGIAYKLISYLWRVAITFFTQ